MKGGCSWVVVVATLRLRIVLDQVAPVQQLQQVAMVDVLLFRPLSTHSLIGRAERWWACRPS